MRTLFAVLGLGLLISCAAGNDSDDGSNGSNSTSGAGASSSSGLGGNIGNGGFTPGGGAGGEGDSCQAVDLLFVIDNSPSMGPHQEDLAAAFPGFVSAMYANLPSNVNLHVGITTTSFFTGSCSESVSNCVTTASSQEVLNHYITPDSGDTGTNGEQGRLFEYNGQRYFETNTSDANHLPLETWFTGAATAAGETGCSFEMASAAAGYALHPANAQYNSGFLRDQDTVLLVMVLSDEPDKSPEGVATYHDMLVNAKTECGGEACIITAGLVNPCIEGVNNTLWQFLNSFAEPPIIDDIDNPSAYAAVVGSALAEVVKKKCDEIGKPR